MPSWNQFVVVTVLGLTALGAGSGCAWAMTYTPWMVDDPTTTADDPTALLHYKVTGSNYDVYIADPTSGFSQSAYSDDSNTDVGNQGSGGSNDVTDWIAAQFSLDAGDLSFVGGGACDSTAGLSCNSSGNDGTLDLGDDTATIFFIHFDNKAAAFEYDTPLSVFMISSLSQGVSNIFAYAATDGGGGAAPPGEVPLPAALPLFGTALVGAGLIGWRKRRRAV